MHLRLMGSADLINRWALILERLGVPGQIYPQRRGTGLRLYVEFDDRQAAALAASVNIAQGRSALTKRTG